MIKVTGYTRKEVNEQREAARKEYLSNLDASFEPARKAALSQKHFHGMMHNCCTSLRN